MRTNFKYFNNKKELVSDKLVGSVTELSTEKQMTVFPDIKEQVVIFRFRDRLNMRSGFIQYYDPISQSELTFSIVKNLKVSKGTSVYGSERRGGL